MSDTICLPGAVNPVSQMRAFGTCGDKVLLIYLDTPLLRKIGLDIGARVSLDCVGDEYLTMKLAGPTGIAISSSTGRTDAMVQASYSRLPCINKDAKVSMRQLEWAVMGEELVFRLPKECFENSDAKSSDDLYGDLPDWVIAEALRNSPIKDLWSELGRRHSESL